jgi:arsenate reductase
MKKKVLFLCTGNTCRSQMAQAVINEEYGEIWEAVSAGTFPGKETNPNARKVLAEIGIEHEGHPKSPDVFRDDNLDLVITICDDAAENCPAWLGEGSIIHHGLPDPLDAEGSAEEVLAVYRAVLGRIQTEIPPILDAHLAKY